MDFLYNTVEIVLVRYKNLEAEERCLESVRKYTDLTKHKLTVFDNAAENTNLGKLWNQLIEASDEEVICLLNSDCVVEEGWTQLENSATCGGASGPVTDNCGTYQKGLPKNGEIEEINDLSGFCYVFRKSVWKEVGKFPEDMPFYGQESVFNRKLQDRGYLLMVDRRVFVSHEKGSSFKKAIERGEKISDEEEWGAFHYYNYLDRLKILRSIVKPDFKIIVIGGGRNNPFPLHRGLEQACDEFFGSNALILRDVHCIPEILDIFQPNLVLNTETKYKEEVYSFLKQAKRKGIKTALYFNDLRCPITQAIECDPAMQVDLTPFYDAVFLCNETHRKCWEDVGKVKTYYMPQGTIQHPKPLVGTRYKILHIGAEGQGPYHQNRNAILRDLRSAGVEITSKNSWHRDERIKIQESSYGDYHASDFSLSISMAVDKYTSDRLYTITGAGGCALAYNPGGLDDIFTDNENILFFKTSAEARKIIESTTDEKIERIKMEAFKYAQKHHTYKMRLLNILQNLYTEYKTFHGDRNNLWKIGRN